MASYKLTSLINKDYHKNKNQSTAANFSYKQSCILK